MDKKIGVLALFLSAMVGACSNDESVINEGGENNGQEVGYIAVNIVQPKSAGSRTELPGGFEYGTADENAAAQALFFIFNSGADPDLYSAQRIDLSDPIKEEDKIDNDHTVERIYKAVLVIDGVGTKPTDIKQLVCVLNAPIKLENDVHKLSDLTDKIDDYCTSTSGNFIMSNSVYMDGNAEKLGTPIESSKIHTSAPTANNDPVDIYVERVVAKIRVKSKKTTDGTASAFENTKAHPVVDGEQKTFDIVPTGIEIANIAKTSKLFKELEGVTWPAGVTSTEGWDITSWNKSSYFRSYWEVTPSVEYDNHSYNDIAKTDFAISTVDFTEYIQPNTKQGQKTSILVTARLQESYTEEGSNEVKYKDADLAYIRGGYTTKDGALAHVAQYVANKGFFKKVETSSEGITYENLPISDFEWKNVEDEPTLKSKLKRHEVFAQVKNATSEIYKRTIAEDGTVNYVQATVEEINNLLQTDDGLKYKARVYTDGMCYYFVNIDQSTVVGLTPGTLEGVVRNHIYDLTLNSIGGVGVPVFRPGEDIIPEEVDDTEDLFYLSARVNVLDWRLVTQGISFGENDTPSTGN